MWKKGNKKSEYKSSGSSYMVDYMTITWKPEIEKLATILQKTIKNKEPILY